MELKFRLIGMTCTTRGGMKIEIDDLDVLLKDATAEDINTVLDNIIETGLQPADEVSPNPVVKKTQAEIMQENALALNLEYPDVITIIDNHVGKPRTFAFLSYDPRGLLVNANQGESDEATEILFEYQDILRIALASSQGEDEDRVNANEFKMPTLSTGDNVVIYIKFGACIYTKSRRLNGVYQYEKNGSLFFVDDFDETRSVPVDTISDIRTWTIEEFEAIASLEAGDSQSIWMLAETSAGKRIYIVGTVQGEIQHENGFQMEDSRSHPMFIGYDQVLKFGFMDQEYPIANPNDFVFADKASVVYQEDGLFKHVSGTPAVSEGYLQIVNDFGQILKIKLKNIVDYLV